MITRFVSKNKIMNSFTGYEVPAESLSINLVKEDEKFFYCGPPFAYIHDNPVISTKLNK